MRIALDATYAVGRNLSGVGVYSREIISALSHAHPESQFLCCYRPHRFLASFRAAIDPNCRRRLMYEPLVPRAAVFHGLNQRLPRARLAAAVTTFHDLFVITEEYSTPEFRRRFEALARDAAERSDRIIAVSEFTASEIERILGVGRDRIRVVPHGLTMPAAVPADDTRDKVILHVGAIQKRKNVARLVRAFGAMDPGWRLVLAGSVGYGSQETLAEIAASPRRADIDVLGYVPARDLPTLYARASVLAFPSHAEGFGIPLLEAMAWGVPAVTSAGSALAEVGGQAVLAVDPNDTDAIASALRSLARDTDLRAKLIRGGRERAAAFTWEAAAEKTWAVYAELMGT